MGFVGQWRQIESGLPERWQSARLLVTVPDKRERTRAAAVLGPAGAARAGSAIRLSVGRGGRGVSPDGLRRLLWRLDQDRIAGDLTLADAEEAAAPEDPRPRLAAAWDAETSKLPDDWSDAYAQIDFVSGGHLERAALLLAPGNPGRHDDSPSFRFRAARNFGYGAAPGMVRRCLERLDAEGIRGDVRILRALSDTDPVGTQGPVWYVGGRPV